MPPLISMEHTIDDVNHELDNYDGVKSSVGFLLIKLQDIPSLSLGLATPLSQ
jgi:hypothetical protein